MIFWNASEVWYTRTVYNVVHQSFLIPPPPSSLPAMHLSTTVMKGKELKLPAWTEPQEKTMKYFISSLTLVGEYFVIGIASEWYVYISVQLSYYSFHYHFVCNLPAARRERAPSTKFNLTQLLLIFAHDQSHDWNWRCITYGLYRVRSTYCQWQTAIYFFKAGITLSPVASAWAWRWATSDAFAGRRRTVEQTIWFSTWVKRIRRWRSSRSETTNSSDDLSILQRCTAMWNASRYYGKQVSFEQVQSIDLQNDFYKYYVFAAYKYKFDVN